MNFRKKCLLFIFLTLFLSCCLPVGVKAASVKTVEIDTDMGAVYAPPYEGFISDFRKQTVMSLGTDGRLDEFLRKLNNGESVIIVANGGSITEGSGSTNVKYSYADRFVQGIKQRYPNAQIEYLNVGISAQSSCIGIMAYDKDVTWTLQNRVPDLMLIDYAVNDAQDPTYGAGYESIIRKTLERGNTAVMLVMSEFANGYNKQDNYSSLGFFYGLPMMSIKNALDPAIQNGYVTKGQFFYDELHPTDYGHYLMSEGLLEIIDQKQCLIDTIGYTPVQPLSNGYLYATSYRHMNYITSDYEVICNDDFTIDIQLGTSENVNLSVGDFWSKDVVLRESRRFDSYPFGLNFSHETYMGNSPLTLTLECKNFLINYKSSSSTEFGEAYVEVDGEFRCYLQGYDAAGYNNSNIAILFNDNETQKHTITIKMASGSEDKKFTIYGIAYTK